MGDRRVAYARCKVAECGDAPSGIQAERVCVVSTGMLQRLVAITLVLVACGEPEPATPEQAATAALEETAPEETPAAEECHFMMRVAGAHEFTDEVSSRIAVVDRQGVNWTSFMASRMEAQPAYVLNFMLPTEATGDVPLYEEGMNKLTLNLIGEEEYSAHEAHARDMDPGSVTVTRPREGWVAIEGDARLRGDEGTGIEVALDILTAVPPLRCP